MKSKNCLAGATGWAGSTLSRGIFEADYEEIDNVAQEIQRGVLAVGNFALTVVLLQKLTEIAARYIPH